ncbi:MAG: hypothetical protein K5867_09475 [Bacteroidales bacterium]|nr:hypothetical protein [Bacteroidales bacterium]
MNNERFERIKAKHPDWSDEKIWMAVSLDMETDETIERGGKNIDANDPHIWETIISRAKEWLSEVLPVIFEKVKEFFTNVLNQIREWISKNIPVVMEKIQEFLGKLTILR